MKTTTDGKQVVLKAIACHYSSELDYKSVTFEAVPEEEHQYVVLEISSQPKPQDIAHGGDKLYIEYDDQIYGGYDAISEFRLEEKSITFFIKKVRSPEFGNASTITIDLSYLRGDVTEVQAIVNDFCSISGIPLRGR